MTVSDVGTKVRAGQHWWQHCGHYNEERWALGVYTLQLGLPLYTSPGEPVPGGWLQVCQ